MSSTEGIVEPFGYGLAYQDWFDVPSPAAGATASVTVEGAWFLRPVAARALLTTDANVANRLLTVDYINARTTTYVQNGTAKVLPASQTNQVYEWHRNRAVGENATGTPIWAPLLDVLLEPGFAIKFNVLNIQAGDQLSGLRIWVEKFPTGARGYPQGMERVPDLVSQSG